jgi:hypothetical protein
VKRVIKHEIKISKQIHIAERSGKIYNSRKEEKKIFCRRLVRKERLCVGFLQMITIKNVVLVLRNVHSSFRLYRVTQNVCVYKKNYYLNIWKKNYRKVIKSKVVSRRTNIGQKSFLFTKQQKSRIACLALPQRRGNEIKLANMSQKYIFGALHTYAHYIRKKNLRISIGIFYTHRAILYFAQKISLDSEWV